MCGRYQFSADEYKEIRQIVRDAQWLLQTMFRRFVKSNIPLIRVFPPVPELKNKGNKINQKVQRKLYGRIKICITDS